MWRTFPPFLLLLAASFAFAQNSRSVEASASASPVQVVYVVEGTTIVTYNVDSTTLSATPVGTPLTVPNASTRDADRRSTRSLPVFGRLRRELERISLGIRHR